MKESWYWYAMKSLRIDNDDDDDTENRWGNKRKIIVFFLFAFYWLANSNEYYLKAKFIILITWFIVPIII